MITLVFFLGAIFLGLLKPRSRIVSLLLLMLIFIIIAYRNDGIDFDNYMEEYECAIFQTSEDIHYVGWLLLEKIGHEFHLSFREFVIFITLLSCICLYIGLRQITINVNFALALFLIYPFGLDAVQMRMFLIDSILVYACLYLVKKTPTNKNCIFLILTILAASIHFAASIFVLNILVSILLKRCVKKKYFMILLSVVILMVIFILKSEALNSLLISVNPRIEYWLNSRMHFGWIIPVGFTILIFSMLIYCTNILNNTKFYSKIDFDKYSAVVYSLLLLIPFLMIDVTFDRLWRVYLLLLYALSSEVFFCGYRQNAKKINLLFALLIFFVGVNFYDKNIYVLKAIL